MMARPARHLLVAAVVVGLGLAPRAQAPVLPGPLDRLFADYVAAGEDPAVIDTAIASTAAFARLAHDFNRDTVPGPDARAHRPAQAAFLLDVAAAALRRHDHVSGPDRRVYELWLDFLEQGRLFVTRRPDPPGQNPAWDAFELAWHKAALALVSGIRRPDYVDKYVVAPLARRVAPEPPASGPPELVDPWIEIARGYADEAATMEPGGDLSKGGPAAIAHYDIAARYASTRPEAIARKGWVLLRLKRNDEALQTLNAFSDSWKDDSEVLFWSRLFRGRAHERLGHVDAAAEQFTLALAIEPRGQSAKLALMSLELARDQRGPAVQWAVDVKTSPEEPSDPFWQYPYGDFRVLAARFEAMRAMSRR